MAVVAVPAKNEAERLAACLDALEKQTDGQGGLLPAALFGVLFLVNNACDDSAEIIRKYAVGSRLNIRVVEVTLPAHRSHAGGARRAAMDMAADWLDEAGPSSGVLLTSDADSRVAPDWLWSNLRAFSDGAETVLGQISLDEESALLSPALHARGKLESVYGDLLTELGARLDPQACNPWPHHATVSGASLAVTRAIYRRIGGLPPAPLGEDKALVALLRRFDARIRFDPDVRVLTSGRTQGRAAGGVADALRLRNQDPAAECDEALEDCTIAYRRALWRGRLRRTGLDNAARWRKALRLPEMAARRIAKVRGFGEAWEFIEQGSPLLVRRALRPQELPGQIEAASRLLRRLQALAPTDEHIEPVLWPSIAAADVDEIA